jgi:type IV secretory pathway component VirB8
MFNSHKSDKEIPPQQSPLLDQGHIAHSKTDKLGLYPSERDVPGLESRRYLWTARAFAVGLFLSLSLNAVLGFAIMTLTPLLRVEPMLLTFKDKSEQIVRIEPFDKDTQGYEVMTEMLVRDYVLARHEIVLDESELKRRWGGQGILAFRSSAEEYQRFVKETAVHLDEIRQKKLVRAVTIHRASKIAEGYWQVEFSTRDMLANNKVADMNWVASMTIENRPAKVRYEDRFMNPLGFQVTAYSVTSRLS